MEDYAIYLDLDGVMADYDAGIRSLGFLPDPAKKNDLNRSGTDDPFKRSMYEAIRGTDFYRKLPFMPGALGLYRAISQANPIILTAAPKFGATEDDYFLNPYWLGAAYHKRAWVESRLLPAVMGKIMDDFFDDEEAPAVVSIYDKQGIPLADERFICTTSARKQQFINRKHSDHQILIDDRRDNCVRWARAGGAAILHTDPATTQTALFHYLDPGARRLRFQTVEAPGCPDRRGMLCGLDDARTWAEIEAASRRND